MRQIPFKRIHAICKRLLNLYPSSSVTLPGGKQAAGSNRKPYIFRVDGPSWISSADTLDKKKRLLFIAVST
jgi:hypothetical protein